MLFFGNKKSESIPSSGMNQPINADDFFKDMGRKPKKTEVDANIAIPDIIGLRDEPLPPPGSTIKNIASVSTDDLIDKTDYDDGFIHGNIVTVNTSALDVDTALSRDKEKNNGELSERIMTSQNPDDFFKDIDRRRGRGKTDIAVPEVTGLREEPLPPPRSTIRSVSEISTDDLIDKTGIISEGLGNISTVNTDLIDTDVLGSKR